MICCSENYFSEFSPFMMNSRFSTIRETTEYLLAQEQQRNELINLNEGVSAMHSTFYPPNFMYHVHLTRLSFCVFFASLKMWLLFALMIIFMSLKTR